MEENDKFDEDELIDEIQNILLDDAYRIDDGSIESMLGIESIEGIEGSESSESIGGNKKANCNPNEKLECSCGRMYTRTNKSRHFKKWHDEQVNSQRNVSITCYCGRMYTRTNKSRHFKKWHP